MSSSLAKPKIIAIVAMDKNRVIGGDNKLLWHLPEDMRRFSSLTRGHTVLMGRKTYFSLPQKFRPLPGRKNVVATRNMGVLQNEDGIEIVSNLEEYITDCRQGLVSLPSDKLWIIGGEEIYRTTLSHCDEISLTLVDGEHQGDAYFPPFENEFVLAEESQGEGCLFRTYRRRA